MAPERTEALYMETKMFEQIINFVPLRTRRVRAPPSCQGFLHGDPALPDPSLPSPLASGGAEQRNCSQVSYRRLQDCIKTKSKFSLLSSERLSAFCEDANGALVSWWGEVVFTNIPSRLGDQDRQRKAMAEDQPPMLHNNDIIET
jgi:hypothetical protein